MTAPCTIRACGPGWRHHTPPGHAAARARAGRPHRLEVARLLVDVEALPHAVQEVPGVGHQVLVPHAGGLAARVAELADALQLPRAHLQHRARKLAAALLVLLVAALRLGAVGGHVGVAGVVEDGLQRPPRRRQELRKRDVAVGRGWRAARASGVRLPRAVAEAAGASAAP